MEQRISIVTLGTADLARACAFWEAMGMDRRGRGSPGIAFFQMGAMVLGLYPFDKLAEDCGLPEAGVNGRVTLAYNTRGEAEVDAVLAEAVAAGGSILKPAHRAFWGGWSGYFADPDGHPWEVAHNPFFPLGEKGEIILPD